MGQGRIPQVVLYQNMSQPYDRSPASHLRLPLPQPLLRLVKNMAVAKQGERRKKKAKSSALGWSTDY